MPPEINSSDNSYLKSVSSTSAKNDYVLLKSHFSNKLMDDAVLLECEHEFSREEI